MSVQYRALWTDNDHADPLAYLQVVRDQFSAWVMDDPHAAPLADGSSEMQMRTQQGWGTRAITLNRHRVITVRSVHSDSVEGIDCVAEDSDTGEGTSGAVWTTVVRAVTDLTTLQTLVENRVVSDDVTQRVAVGRPRLVDELLAASQRPLLGGSGILLVEEAIPAHGVNALVEYLQSPTRTLPMIVCTEPRRDHGDRWLARAGRIARRVSGIATVVTLDTGAASNLRSQLHELAVWDGAIRIYAPSPVSEPADGWRHRFILDAFLSDRETSMVDRIVWSVSQMSTRRRTPEIFEVFATSQTVHPARGADVALRHEAEVEYWREQLDTQLDENSATEKELAAKIGHLNRIRAALEANGDSSLFWGALHDDGTGRPDEVPDTTTAVVAAQIYLTEHLLIHDDAPRELQGIDTAPQAYSWGNKAWRGFQALAAYTEGRKSGFRGHFWEWCQEGGPFAWPANTKHLSMTESDTVRNNSKFMQARNLPIDTRVDKSGRAHMVSHLKISEGGGDLAPRIYFYDDSDGATGQVHVGFVGPHYLMPNTKS